MRGSVGEARAALRVSPDGWGRPRMTYSLFAAIHYSQQLTDAREMHVPLRVDWGSTTTGVTGLGATFATCPLRPALKRLTGLLVALLLCTGVTGVAATADEVRPHRIQIEYVAYSNPAHRQLYDLLKQQQALERLQGIFNPFRLPVDLTLRTIGCNGVANAWYMPGFVSADGSLWPTLANAGD